MYVPAAHAEPDPAVMLDYVAAHPFGVLVTAAEGGPFASHLPFVVDRAPTTAGPHGTLRGHLARANPHARLAQAEEGMVIFGGPDAYVSPSWYASKREHGRVVPTWNYVAVHVRGPVRFVDDPAFLHENLRALTDQHERGRPAPWSVDDAPEGYIEQLARAVIGVEIPIARLTGKWKVSQNRPAADVDGVIAALGASGDPRERAIAAIMEARRPR